MERCLVLWVPDWPVAALVRARGETVPADAPIAVLAGNVVVACSPAARRAGVRRGMRRRDAHARAPDLRIAAQDPGRDAREFLPVVDRIEELAPGLQIIRPGLAAIRIRGPARYYGGELPAAQELIDRLRAEGFADAAAGVADGRFTAEQAARGAAPVLIVPPGEAAEFLAPIRVEALGDEQLARLLVQLGVRTLGEFAALGDEHVLERFGPAGAHLHALAAGRDSRRVAPRRPPPELAREIAFDPPLTIADQIAFGIRVGAEEFVAGLAAHRLACTELRIELVGEGGGSERVWAHTSSFDAAAIVDRVRWQLDALGTRAPDSRAPDARAPDANASGPGTPGSGSRVADALAEGVASVRLSPEAVDPIGAHEPGLFGGTTDERVHRALSRVQAILGHRGVLTASIGGGRRLAERTVLTPWGERTPTRTDTDRPWPGSLPPPHPSAVPLTPIPVVVESAAGAPVRMRDRTGLDAPPSRLRVDGTARRITEWAGPWPLVEHGWDPAAARRADRFQVVDETGSAWLLLLDGGEWSIEAGYD